MADTVYRVMTYYDADTRGAKSEVSSLASVADHALNLLERGKEMISSVVELHGAVENATIAIAGLMSAGDYPGAKNFQTALGMSSEIIQQMRKDARDLPGEMEDLQGIFQFSLLGGSQAGKSVNQVEQMSAQLMAATKALGISSEFAGREFAELMEGRASKRVKLFSNLQNMMGDGMDAAKFNALSAPERWERIQKALGSFGPMIQAYSHTWDAVSSTTADYAKNLLRVGSSGVFEGLKGTLISLNGWYEKNEHQILAVSTALFDGIGGAFAYVADMVTKAAPYLWSFFTGVYDGASGAFGALKEVVIEAAELFDDMFGSSLSVSTDNMHDLGATIGSVVGVMADIGVAIGIAEAAQWAWNAAMSANPIGLIAAGVVALGGALAVLISYWDDMMDRLDEMMANPVGIWMMKKAGVMPENATDEDVAQGLGGSKRDRDRRSADMKALYGDDGVGAHVKSLLQIDPAKPALASGLEKPKDSLQKLLDMQRKASSHKQDMNVHVRIEQTINDADNPRRVLDMTKRALRDALEQPTRSFVAGVYR